MLYAKIAIVVAVVLAAYWKGYSDEHERFLKFQAEVAAIGKAQELAVQHAVKTAEIISEGVKDEYEVRVAALRSQYAGRVRNTNSGSCPLPTVSAPARIVNGGPDDPAIVGLCAVETAKLVALQKWITKQQENQK